MKRIIAITAAGLALTAAPAAADTDVPAAPAAISVPAADGPLADIDRSSWG